MVKKGRSPQQILAEVIRVLADELDHIRLNSDEQESHSVVLMKEIRVLLGEKLKADAERDADDAQFRQKTTKDITDLRSSVTRIQARLAT